MELNVDRIKFEMGQLGWNQTDLAMAMNKKRQWINELLANPKASRTLETIQEIARAFSQAGRYIEGKDLLK